LSIKIAIPEGAIFEFIPPTHPISNPVFYQKIGFRFL
jgi:hypothetical protein